jgi:hypothetical protein
MLRSWGLPCLAVVTPAVGVRIDCAGGQTVGRVHRLQGGKRPPLAEDLDPNSRPAVCPPSGFDEHTADEPADLQPGQQAAADLGFAV